MRFLLFFLFIILVSGCEVGNNEISCVPSQKVKLVNEIRSKVAAKLNKDFGLIVCGTGAQMMHQIEMLALSFDYGHLVDVEQGRKLVVSAVNEFVSEINADERIRSYLVQYPFQPENIEIRIFFCMPDGNKIPVGELSSISFTRGNVTYRSFDSKKFQLDTIYKETFAEAVEQIKVHERKAV